MKKTTKVTGIAAAVIISICAIVLGFTAVNAYAFSDNLPLSERELYNATNTYNVNDECFDEDDKFIEDREGVKPYRIDYNMNEKNGNRVMNTTQVTVLTHGLGGSAKHWSNNFSESNYEGKKVHFAYDNESLIARIDEEVGGANIYWAVINSKNEEENEESENKKKTEYEFHLYDITDQKINNEVHNRDNEIDHITDTSKHIIIVFEAYEPNGSNDSIYYQFNYMMSRVAYDLKALNGGLLPKFNLVGHSRGGLTNMQYALDHPDMVDSLVSLSTPYFGSTTANLFGEIYMGGPSDGLDDLLEPELYYWYNERWNKYYDKLYKDINAYAFGSYHTLSSLIDVISNTYGENVLPNWSKPVISTALAVVNAYMFVCRDYVVASKAIVRPMGRVLDWFFPNDKVGDVLEIIGKEITYDVLPSFVAWRSDLLVPLESQLATDTGSAFYGGGDYKGFKRLVRPFIGGDANYEKISDPAPPVGHNLEARDSILINNVLSVLNFGTAGFMSEEKEDGTAKIIGYRGVYESSDLAIPETINGKTVTEIDRYAFLSFEKSGIEKITLPNTVKTIGMYAFSDFTHVTEIRMSGASELQAIEQGAFNNCSSLQSIALPQNIKTLFGNAFVNCESLSSVSVDSRNAYYTSVDGVLYNKDKSILVYYPQGKTDTAYSVDYACLEIGYYAFAGNTHLRSLNLNNVTMIREYGVASCPQLQSLRADKLNYVDSGVFGETKLFDETDGDFVSVGNVLLAYNGNAKDLTVGDEYVSVAPYAFTGNETLETVRFEGNVMTNIGKGAFYGCDNLKSVYINNLNRIVSVSSTAFGSSVNNIYVPAYLKSEYDDNDIWKNYSDKLSVHTTNVKFESNGGSECADTAFSYGDYIGELPEPSKRGYTFDGWYEKSDLSVALSQTDMWKDLSDSLTVYAKWSPIYYRISFVIDVETGATDSELDGTYTIEDGVVFGVSEKAGYTFGGWYADKNFTQAAVVGFDAGETGDKTYYAKWIAVTSVVRLNVNDTVEFPATVSEKNYTVEYGVDDFGFATPQRTGFTFNGWYADVNGQKLFMTDADGISIKKWDIDAENVELYADWTRNIYYIKINSDGTIMWLGVDGFTDIKTPIEYGTLFDTASDMEEAFNPEKISLKVGHKFRYFQLSDGTKFTLWDQIGSKFNPGDTVEIYAVFEKEINFTINFTGYDLNDENPFRGAFGDEIKYLSVARYGYTFKYWIVSDSIHNQNFVGTVLAPGTVFNYSKMPDLSIDREEDGTAIYLKAVFEANKYTLAFDTKRGWKPGSIDILFDESKMLPVISVIGYDFLGWETSGGRQIAGADGVMLADWDIASDQILHAKWEIIVYTITYELNGGTNSMINEKEYTIESQIIYLYSASKAGNRFMGWFEDASMKNKIFSIPHGSHGDITVYANFAKIIYVRFNSNGGTPVADLSGIEGDPITLPTPIRTGYKGTWEYWGYLTNDSSVSNFGEEYKIGSTDVTFTANWERCIFHITFYTNGGSGGTSSIEVEYGKKLPIIELPTRTAHNFLGYYTSTTGGTKYYEFFDFNRYPESYYYSNYSHVCDFKRDINLFAQWEPMTWNIYVRGFIYGSGYVNFPNSSAYPTNISLSYNQQQIYYVPGILDYDLTKWELTYDWGSVADGTSTRIDLTNLCKGNYSSYTLTFYYSYNPFSCTENDMKVVIVDKIDSTWKIRLTNKTGKARLFEYNAKMCFKNDARDWSGLKDVCVANDNKEVEPDKSVLLSITENAAATSIAISYVDGDKRYIFYADQLSSTKHTMSSYASEVDATQDSKCIAEGTLITLADGTQKAVENLTGNEMLRVWNLYTGTYDVAPIMFIDSDPAGYYSVIKLSFSDGTIVKVISEHGFWDIDLNRYVYLDENAAEYIGHRFLKQSGNGTTKVTLINVSVATELTTTYSPVTYGHLCYFVNGMLSMPGGIDGLFNIFEVNGETLAYNIGAMTADIETYGLFTYEEFYEIYPISEEVFEAFNGRYLKVAIGKGLITEERIGQLIERYSRFF